MIQNSLSLEYHNPTIMTFAEATQKRDQIPYFDDTCRICTNEFTQDERVTLLACKHLFHAHCLNEWQKQKQECPIDHKPTYLRKIVFLNRTLSLQSSLVDHLNRLISEKTEMLSECIQKTRTSMSQEEQKEFEALMGKLKISQKIDLWQFLVDNAQVIEEALLKDLSKMAEKDGGAIVEKRISFVFELAQLLTDAFGNKMIDDAELDKFWANNGEVLTKLIGPKLIEQFGNDKFTLSLMLMLLCFHYPELGKTVTKLLEKITLDPFFKHLEWKENQKFYMRHFKQLKGKSSLDQYKYLLKLSRVERLKLYSLTEGNSRTSVKIRKKITNINKFRKAAGITTGLLMLGLTALQIKFS